MTDTSTPALPGDPELLAGITASYGDGYHSANKLTKCHAGRDKPTLENCKPGTPSPILDSRLRVNDGIDMYFHMISAMMLACYEQ